MILVHRRRWSRAARWAILGLTLLAVSCGESGSHRDGEGAVTSFDDLEGFSRMAVDPKPGVDAWSYGMPLCLEEGNSGARLRDVSPTDTVGSGFEFVDAFIHEYAPARGDSGIISVDGFPPDISGTLIPIDGYILDTRCTQDRTVELIVGLRMTSSDGGGWKGAKLSYTVGDDDYVLKIHNEMLICGDSVAELCQGPPSSWSAGRLPGRDVIRRATGLVPPVPSPDQRIASR